MINKHIAVQCQYVTWQLEKALGNLPSDYFDISDEVQEQVRAEEHACLLQVIT